MELTRNLKLDEVARLKPTPPHDIAPDATIGDAIRLMRSNGSLEVKPGPNSQLTPVPSTVSP